MAGLPELREFRELGQRVTISDYVAAAVSERHVDGAAAEYNQHVFGTFAQGDYPLEMLLDRDEYFDLDARTWGALVTEEKRTQITGVASNTGNITFVDRLLASSEAAYLRAQFPAVGPGRHSYPVVSGGSVAGVIARGTAETPSGGITIVNADPARIQHSYEYAATDELQMPGIANALASDLRMSLASGLDNKVVDDLVSALTRVAIAATVTTASLLAAVHGVVDGKAARYFSEVQLLAGNTGATSQTTAFERIGALLAASTIDAVFAWLASIRASAHMGAAAGGEDDIIVVKTGPAPTRLVVPVWRRGTLLRDTGRLQLEGAITLTGVMYADVILAKTDIHTLLEVETQ